MIHATIFGNLTADAEQSQLGDGTAIAKFRIASNDGTREQKHATFVGCALFGARAPKLAPLLKKGNRVLVIGTLKTNEWEKRDGTKATDIEVRVSEVQIVDYPEEDQQGGAAPASGERSAPAAAPPPRRAAPGPSNPWDAPGTDFFPKGATAATATHYARSTDPDWVEMPKKAVGI